MNQQASQINQKFKLQIRRRQRQDKLKKQRQILYAYQRKQQQKQKNKQKIQYSKSNTINILAYKTIKQLYEVFNKSVNFMQEIGEQQLYAVMCFILTNQSLESIQGASLIGAMIQYCGSLNVETVRKKNIIRQLLNQSKIEFRIFELAIKSMKTLQHNKLKIYLYCIKNMALVRMQNILNKQLLAKYLPQILQNLCSQPSVLIFLTYVSQTYILSAQTVKQICDQASSRERNTKIFILTILNNYITLQQNKQTLYILFQKIIQTLSHLHINCKQYSQKYSLIALRSMIQLISKFPDHLPKDLLTKIVRTKLQDLMIVMLSVSNQQTKCIVYQLQETIVDKTIHELKEQFFECFSFDIIEQFLMGIQYTNINIVSRSIKIISKLLHYAPRNIIKKLQASHQLSLVLEDLSYHKNEYIATVAQNLKGYFVDEDQMNDI